METKENTNVRNRGIWDEPSPDVAYEKAREIARDLIQKIDQLFLGKDAPNSTTHLVNWGNIGGARDIIENLRLALRHVKSLTFDEE